VTFLVEVSDDTCVVSRDINNGILLPNAGLGGFDEPCALCWTIPWGDRPAGCVTAQGGGKFKPVAINRHSGSSSSSSHDAESVKIRC
jgi:hypothetical protein